MVEDSREICQLVRELLESIGAFRFIGAVATETEGTAWLESNRTRWDLALIDLVLQDGSGFNLIKRFRRANPAARILVFSSYATPAIRIRCVEIGADAVFSKGEFKALASYVERLRPREQAEPQARA